jgi:hypothetical protein
MMAAQNVFMQQKAQRAVQKASPSLSKMGKASQTPEQSREERLTKN